MQKINWNLREYWHIQKFGMVIFGQLFPEKPKLGKPVQQLRVLIIKQQWNNLSTIWMPKTSNHAKKILAKIIWGNYPHSMQSRHLTTPKKKVIQPYLARLLYHPYAVCYMLNLEQLQIKSSCLLLTRTLSLRHSGNDFQPLELKTRFTSAKLNCLLRLLRSLLDKILASLQSTHRIW